MARSFNGSSDRGQASPPVAEPPFTVAGWFRPTSTGSIQTLVSISPSGAEHTQQVGINHPSGGSIYAQSYKPGENHIANTSGAFTVNQWTHVAAVYASASSRTVYRDGANSGSNGGTSTAQSPDNLQLGALRYNGGISSYFNGNLGGFAVWDVALTADEIALLAGGADPRTVRPESLVWLMDPTGADLIGARDITWTGTQYAEPVPYVVRRTAWGPFPFAASASGPVSLAIGVAPVILTAKVTGRTATVARALSAAAVILSPQAVVRTVGAVARALSAAAVILSPQAVVRTVGAVARALSAAAVILSPQAVGRTATVARAISAAAVTLSPQAVVRTVGAVALALSPASVTLAAQTVGRTLGAAAVALGVAAVTLVAKAVGIDGVAAEALAGYATGWLMRRRHYQARRRR